MEIWRDIEGFEGLYQVSSWGRVKSLERRERLSDGRYRTRHEKIRTTRINREGYEQLTIWKNSKQHTMLVHKLVASAFLKRPSDNCEVNHIDGCKFNNHVDNLEWVTHSENVRHSFDKLGRVIRCKHRKLTSDQVREIRASDLTDTQLAEHYPVTRSAIYLIRANKTYKDVV